MTIVIRLDTNALKYLIESQGDEFVLEIKTAVLNNAMSRIIKSVVTPEIRKAVEVETERVMREELGKRTGSGWSRSFDLSESAKRAIRRQVLNILDDEIHTAAESFAGKAEKMAESLMENIEGNLESRFSRKLSTVLDEYIQKAVKERVDLALALTQEED